MVHRPLTPDGNNGWYKSALTVNFNGTDATSGIASCASISYSGPDNAAATVNGACTDNAGNTSAVVASSPFKYDATAPTDVSGAAVTAPANGSNGWYKSALTVNFNGTDATSGIASCASISYSGPDNAAATVNGACTDNAGNTSAVVASSPFKYDATAPTDVSGAAVPPANGSNGWYKSALTVDFNGTDATSGIASCASISYSGPDNAAATVNGACTDNAGNTSAVVASSPFKYDATAPTVSLVGGPDAGGSYYFGFVPAAPTCTASDTLSGLDGSCSVSGYGTAIGPRSVTATAKDLAGNVTSVTNAYSVLGWTSKGFYQPVDMSTTTQFVYNTVKGGSTVPLKFELFAGLTELTDTAWVDKLVGGLVACNTSAVNDDIELTVTGSTSLRYDTVAGQYIYNWKTPTNLTGKCYSVTALLKDGSSVQVAYFKFK